MMILKTLQDARTTNRTSRTAWLSPAPVSGMRVLGSGVYSQMRDAPDPGAVNLGVAVFVQISLDLQVEIGWRSSTRDVRRPEVLECYLMTGDRTICSGW